MAGLKGLKYRDKPLVYPINRQSPHTQEQREFMRNILKLCEGKEAGEYPTRRQFSKEKHDEYHRNSINQIN